MSWDQYFINVARAVSLKSKDPSTKVGAIIVHYNDNKIISTGYNGFPAGFPDTAHNWTKPRKYNYVVHAELNAIVHAKTDIKGATLYCTLQPCANCMKAIASAGIFEVCFEEERKDKIAEEIAETCFIKMRKV